jgi:hypothetical protein
MDKEENSGETNPAFPASPPNLLRTYSAPTPHLLRTWCGVPCAGASWAALRTTPHLPPRVCARDVRTGVREPARRARTRGF